MAGRVAALSTLPLLQAHVYGAHGYQAHDSYRSAAHWCPYLARVGSTAGEPQVGWGSCSRLLPSSCQQGLQGWVGRRCRLPVASIGCLRPLQAGQEVPAPRQLPFSGRSATQAAVHNKAQGCMSKLEAAASWAGKDTHEWVSSTEQVPWSNLRAGAAPGRLRCGRSSVGRLHRPLCKVGWQLGAQAQLLQQVLPLCAGDLHQC